MHLRLSTLSILALAYVLTVLIKAMPQISIAVVYSLPPVVVKLAPRVAHWSQSEKYLSKSLVLLWNRSRTLIMYLPRYY